MVDKVTDYNAISVQLYNNIHEFVGAGYSNRQIAKLTAVEIPLQSIFMENMKPYAVKFLGVWE